MTVLYFAYGSNMSRAVMQARAPGAEPLGIAALGDYRFMVSGDGYATVKPQRGERVHGVLWRLTLRDRIRLDAWENIAAGHYRPEILPVRAAARRIPALIYIARPRRSARAVKQGYMEIVLAAGQTWELPEPYLASLRRWLPSASGAGSMGKLSEFGCI